MIPSFTLRIQSMLRALREVIIPALPAAERLALDQATILAGNLKIMAEQHDRLLHYEHAELCEYAALVRALSAAAAGGAEIEAAVTQGAAALARAKPLEELPIPTQRELAALTQELKESANQLLCAARRDGAPGFSETAAALVLAQSEAQIVRERRWSRAAGFELQPEQLPSLDDVLRSRPPR